MERQNSPTPPEREFTITRVFNAPRDLVFKAQTEAERLAQWWGPKGFKMLVTRMDLRPGGMFLYCMRSPEGHEMWGKFVYREVVAPERLVFVNSFSDAQGGTVRAPFAPDWPLEVLNIVTFTEHGGKTTLHMRGAPVNATEAERRRFDSFHEQMNQGFGGTLDQLEAYLAGVS
jgi:uncharacterized protein YndB with AHSA1/START domain